jgi:hypothetical protein
MCGGTVQKGLVLVLTRRGKAAVAAVVWMGMLVKR